MKEMLSLLYDEYNALQYLIGSLLIAATGALFQLDVDAGMLRVYIVSIPESFFSGPYIQFLIPVSS
jgi:hypothetical protein